ncbi:MAG: SDR family oxidoreductase [Clostridia bacterium]|nr:SDR family oxidoreductase [Clostridia bacterium]
MNYTFDYDFSGKTCIVTGASRGIGRCIAQRLKACGCRVAVIDRLVPDETDFDLFVQGNIADPAVLESFADSVKTAFGRIDFIVSNACYSNKGLLSGCSWEDFNAVFNTGVTAPYYLCLLLKDSFNEGASIVNIASSRAFMSQPDTESYTAAKGGILALTHALAMSLSGKARVNSISPGWIETDPENENAYEDHVQQPVGRIGCPDDIAACCMFLLSSNSGFITGENITVDGGMTKNMIYHGDNGWTYRP